MQLFFYFTGLLDFSFATLLIKLFASRAEDLTDDEETFPQNELAKITQTVKNTELCLNITEELFREVFFFFFNFLFLLHIWQPQNIRTTDNI